MIFKNATIFRLTESLQAKTETLEAAFEAKAFAPCSGIRPASFGWVQPFPERPLINEISGCVLFCGKREEKVIPSTALADIIAEKVARLETLEGRPIRAKEKQRLRDDALSELLPRALPKSKQIFGYLSRSDDLLVIDSASTAEVDMLVGCLRETLGSLKVVPPQVKSKPLDTFTHWLRTRHLPEYFSFGDHCDLFDPEDGSAVTFRKQDLSTSEVRAHLETGKHCTRLSLIWRGELKVIIDKDLILRQIKVLSSEDTVEDGSDPAAEFDAAFVNTSLELSRFLPALYSALGGESRD